MTSEQLNRLAAILVENAKAFAPLSAADFDWVLGNPESAISIWVKALKSRSAAATPLLEHFNTVDLAVAYPFVAQTAFRDDGYASDRVSIATLSDDFITWFLPKIESSGPVNISFKVYRYEFFNFSTLQDLVPAMAPDVYAIVSLAEIWALMKRHADGLKGTLSERGENLFQVRDSRDILRMVSLRWGFPGYRKGRPSFMGQTGFLGWELNASSYLNPPVSTHSYLFTRSS